MGQAADVVLIKGILAKVKEDVEIYRTCIDNPREETEAKPAFSDGPPSLSVARGVLRRAQLGLRRPRSGLVSVGPL
jgi:hypothetical protein